MRRALAAFTSFALVAALVGAATPSTVSAAENDSISGTVTAGGVPVPNVTVHAYPVSFPSGGGRVADADALTPFGSTGADGTYVLSGLPAGPYIVAFGSFTDDRLLIPEWYGGSLFSAFSPNQSAGEQAAVTVQVEAGLTTPDISGDLAVGGGVAGIKADESGGPLAGVALWIRTAGWGDPNFFMESDPFVSEEDGAYRVYGLTPGRYSLQFFPGPGRAGRSYAVNIMAGQVTQLTGVLYPSGSVAGQVVDVDGNPIADIHVGAQALYPDATAGWEMVPVATMTDAGGQFTLS